MRSRNDTVLYKILFPYKGHSDAISTNLDGYIKKIKSSDISPLLLLVVCWRTHWRLLLEE